MDMSMTVNQVIQQLLNFKKDFGEQIGELPIVISDWPLNREMDSIILVELGRGFEYAEIATQ
jgi:hypothetical protein